MPDTTAKLKLKKPLGNEAVNRIKYNENLDLLDENAAAQTQVDEPFFLKNAVYNETGPSIDLTFGLGRVSFFGSTFSKIDDSYYSITFPAINTNYYIFIQSNGSFTHNTTGSAISGAIRIWVISTENPASQFTVHDNRGQLPGAGAIEAVNLIGGGAGQLPYQVAANTTTMLAAGISGQILKSNGADAPSWVNQSAITSGSCSGNAATATLANYCIEKNLSFEYDTNNDGIPDGWTFTPYTNGSGTIDTQNAIHGLNCFKMIHPGGSGKGGGYLTSDYIPFSVKYSKCLFTVGVWASVAGVQVDVILDFYNGAKSLISSSTIYTSTNNLTTATPVICQYPTIPAGTKFMKVRLIGGNPATTTGGTVYFDFIDLNLSVLSRLLVNQTTGITPTATEVSKEAHHSYTDAFSLPVTIKGLAVANLAATYNLSVESRVNVLGPGGDLRLRCGSVYGDEVHINTNTSVNVNLPITLTNAAQGPINLVVQYKIPGMDTMWVKRTSTNVTVTPTD